MNRIYIIFPYLNTFNTFEIEGIKFKGILESGEKIVNNFASEDEKDQYHLSRIADSFRTPSNQKLRGFIYSIQTISSLKDYESLKQKIQIAINFIRYWAFDDEERNRITFPDTVYYIFEMTEKDWNSKAHKIRSSGNEIMIYRGQRDFSQEVHFYWPRDHIYPFSQHISINDIQITENYLITRILNSKQWKIIGYDEEGRLRLIRAIEHYNRSFSEGIGIDDRDRILSLSAGFEALLYLPDEGIQQAFKGSIMSLLGDIPQLSEWALSFYNLRSKIVHGEEIATSPRHNPPKRKKIPSTYFQHSQGEHEYIKHLTLGQKIFRKCLVRILNTRSEYVGDITSLLVPNEVHIKRIEEKMSKLKDKLSLEDWHKYGILEEYNQLRGNDWTAEPIKIVKLGRYLITLLKVYLKGNNTPLDEEINRILNFSGKFIDLSMLYNDLQEKFSKIYMSGKTVRTSIVDWIFESAVESFLIFAQQKLIVFNGTV